LPDLSVSYSRRAVHHPIIMIDSGDSGGNSLKTWAFRLHLALATVALLGIGIVGLLSHRSRLEEATAVEATVVERVRNPYGWHRGWRHYSVEFRKEDGTRVRRQIETRAVYSVGDRVQIAYHPESASVVHDASFGQTYFLPLLLLLAGLACAVALTWPLWTGLYERLVY
jgi:hypothetical protein